MVALRSDNLKPVNGICPAGIDALVRTVVGLSQNLFERLENGSTRRQPWTRRVARLRGWPLPMINRQLLCRLAGQSVIVESCAFGGRIRPINQIGCRIFLR